MSKRFLFPTSKFFQTFNIITICLDGSYNLGYLVLKEAVCYSQRVEKFEIFVKEGEIWNSIYTGTVFGYKKIMSVKLKTFRIKSNK